MEEKTMKYHGPDILSAALDIAENMVRCGAEIYRVEDSIERICRAYGIGKTEVFSVTSLIIATVRPEQGDSYTETRRIYGYTTSLDRLEKFNSLSRYVCENLPSVEEIRVRIEDINSDKKTIRISSLVGYIMSAAAFTMFFGGTFFDAAATVPTSVVQFFLDSFIKRRGVNRILYTVFTSIISSAMALIFVRLGFGTNVDKIMIGNIMPLIPGLQLTNSIREMFCGDTVSGLIRLLEAIIISISMALGFAVPMLIAGGMII